MQSIQPWTSDKCDPHNDIHEMIEFAKKQTFKNYKEVSIRKSTFEMYKKATGLNTSLEIENEYYKRFDENIKIIIIK